MSFRINSSLSIDVKLAVVITPNSLSTTSKLIYETTNKLFGMYNEMVGVDTNLSVVQFVTSRSSRFDFEFSDKIEVDSSI